MIPIMISSSMIGTIGENLVINDLLRLNCRVYKEVTGSNDVDLVAHNGVRFFRIQVKTVADTTRGILSVSIEKRWRDKTGVWTRSRYTAETVDVIAAVAIDKNVIVYVPLAEFGKQITMSFRIEIPQNSKRKGIHVLSDFSSDRIFGTWRSPVSHHVRDVGIAGSNPAVPTTLSHLAVKRWCKRQHVRQQSRDARSSRVAFEASVKCGYP